MVTRIAYFKTLPQRVLAPEHDGFRKWMAEQPGFIRAYHCRNPETGEGTSVSFWDSRDHLSALRSKTPPGGPIGITPDRVEVYEVEHEF